MILRKTTSQTTSQTTGRTTGQTTGGTNGQLLAAAFAALLLAATASLADGHGAVEEGKALTFDRKKGNCLACHYIAGAVSPGNIGPALAGMKARYPKKEDLRARIWDVTEFAPEAMMPPFGRHKILSEDEITKITEYIYTL
ncbi:MAG: sulfur oxidation c-type cytochrome SoxX [Gammaproteobacteria bacterium]|nr:sulfur oxidation c-type cytochrome SoxX [Gammaproteobacteria bacterium]